MILDFINSGINPSAKFELSLQDNVLTLVMYRKYDLLVPEVVDLYNEYEKVITTQPDIYTIDSENHVFLVKLGPISINLERYSAYSIGTGLTRTRITPDYKISLSHNNLAYIDLCRVGIESKFNFNTLSKLFLEKEYIRIYTGELLDDTTIAITSKQCSTEDITVLTNQHIELRNSEDTTEAKELGYKSELWDSYALTINEETYQYRHTGLPTESSSTKPIAPSDVLDITISKYKSNFISELTRDVDDEEVFIDTSIGYTDTKRVKLINGIGHFKLFTAGYKGNFSIKIGRKYYVPWNDYKLTIKENLEE